MRRRHFRDDVPAWAGLVRFRGGALAPVPVQGRQGFPQVPRGVAISQWRPLLFVFLGRHRCQYFQCSVRAYRVSMQSVKRYKGYY